jgi:hypothetical protein
MGNTNSEYKIHMEHDCIEYYMENDDYMRLSMLFTDDNFNYNRKIPMDGYGSNATCSYLHLAAKNNSLHFIRLWLKYGYPINITDSRGWSILHWAVYYNTSSNIFIQLILSGIDTEVKISNIIKLKNQILINKTAIEMIKILKRTKIYNAYTRFKKAYSKNKLPIYISHNITIDEDEHIPTAHALSESYIIDSIPKNKYKLIRKMCDWNIYSNQYGILMWKHDITGEMRETRPMELRNIVSISYYSH